MHFLSPNKLNRREVVWHSVPVQKREKMATEHSRNTHRKGRNNPERPAPPSFRPYVVAVRQRGRHLLPLLIRPE
jgi:hypothetical protein